MGFNGQFSSTYTLEANNKRETMIVNTGTLPRRGGLHITLNRTEAVYRGGDVLTGTASLELQDSLEIIGEYIIILFDVPSRHGLDFH